MTRFTDENLQLIEDRSQLDPTPDGYPSGGMENTSPSADQTTSVERAALRLIEGQIPPDPQQTSVERINSAFNDMWRAALEAEKAWDFILHVSESIRGRQTTLGTCQACLRDDVPNIGDDRIRAAYCPTCFKAWCRTDKGHGRQDRLSFERERRQLKVMDQYGPKHAESRDEAI